METGAGSGCDRGGREAHRRALRQVASVRTATVLKAELGPCALLSQNKVTLEESGVRP